MNSGISVICSTNKINSFRNILSNFLSQDYEPKELIIGLNYDVYNKDTLERAISNKDIKILPLGSKRSLGECLNTCIELTKYPIIGKFDDDDYYSPLYLSDTVKPLSLDNIDIVGKSSYYVYFAEKKVIGLINPERENKFVNRVSGSTLMFKKEVFQKIKFPNINLGEDVKFCNLAIEKNLSIYSTNRFHYVYIRNERHKHTWKIDNEYILRQCKFISQVNDYKEFILNMCQ
ncbi:MAG: glycosyltransferase family 2 protein [Tissierellia bacterium]|mgnify:CR=1 FL=1|nr:glycosyltransferase family 2 protein [Tissierellia bacterium]